MFEFEQAVAYETKRRGFDGVVCGHIHHAEIKDIDGITYYNCGDWVESCTALIEDFNGQFTLMDWKNHQKPKVAQQQSLTVTEINPVQPIASGQ